MRAKVYKYMKMSHLKYFGLFIIDTNMNGFGTGVYVFGQA